MKKDFISRRPSSSEKKNEPKVIGEVLNEYFRSNEPLAVTYRGRMYHDTHLDVNVKVATTTPGRMPVGSTIEGTLFRDGDDHFLFLEKLSVRKVHRVPIVWSGDAINVHSDGHDVTYVTLRRPRISNEFTLADFCITASRELLTFASFVKA